ncbi:hypothetical protein [Antribacter gilvus]|uniref:hypothetical protein n=1 Tax=Antribacter gilvus TaxID=2304675 RepID=UPI000F79C438|nr:hypothetical protein [Antribacter gilvus]
MPVQAMGPTYAGGAQPITEGGYDVLYLPDVNNEALQQAGESPVFYYVPNRVRMARKDGPDTGDFLFNLVRFAGTGGESVIGSPGEVAGGVLTFSVTGALPEDVRRQTEAQIIAQNTGKRDAFWGIRGGPRPPIFRPVIISESTTTVSNVAPTTRGLPTAVTATRGGREVTTFDAFGMPGRRAGARPMPSARSLRATRDDVVPAGPPSPVATDGAPVLTEGSGSNLDPWYWHMQGQGTGSVDPTGTHGFSGLIGAYPAAICWEAFHGTASPLVVIQNYRMKVWSPVVTLKITGDWDRISESFKSAASGRFLWVSADIKAEVNKMRINGTITVDIKVDTTLPGAEEIARRLDEKSDLVYEKFMDAAKSIIFEPPRQEAEPAEASSSAGGALSPWGAGFSFNYRRDETHLNLEYNETRQFAYLQDHTISNSLTGMYDEMKADPDAARKYFVSVYLDDWPRRLARVVRPVCAWDDGTVDFMSVQVGYPSTTGDVQWDGHAFSADEGGDGSWKYQTTQKVESDVTNKPEGWTSDLTFIKRKVHLAEPPSEASDPYRRVQIQRNVVDLDPEPSGTLLNDTTVEVRADSAGRLSVGPIELGVVLTDNTQKVEAIFEAVDDATGEPAGLGQVRFGWDQSDYDTDRIWTAFTGDPAFRPFYRYKVQVTVKGTLFEPGRSWEGPWVRASGNGPLVVEVPRPDAPGVVTRYVPDARVTRLLEAGPASSGSGTEPVASAAPEVPELVPAGAGARSAPVANGHRTYHDYTV